MGAVASPLNDLWCNQDKKRLPDQETMPEAAIAKFYPDQTVEQQIRLFFRNGLDPKISPNIVPLELEQLAKLLKRITDIHGISYNWQPNIDVQEIIKTIGNNPVRTHIRAVLETLDMEYQYPKSPIHIMPIPLIQTDITSETEEN